MTTDQQTNSQIADALASNYMLVTVSFRTWAGERTDREATQEVIQSKQATRDAGAFVKKLLASADTELEAVKSAMSSLRSFVYASTLPWSGNVDGSRRGPRIIATAATMQFLKDVADRVTIVKAAVEDLKAVWDARVEQAVTNLGGLANRSDYPAAADLDKYFDVYVDVRPLPAPSDFSRLNVPASLATALAERMSKQTEAEVKTAMDELKKRLLAELSRMATQLGKVGRGEKTRLYDTLTSNLTDLVQLARSMNLTGSNELSDLANDIEAKLLRYPVDTFKGNAALAATVAAEAERLATVVEQPDVFF